MHQLISLIKKRSFKQSDTKSFLLTSGKKSQYYFNLKTITYHPIGIRLIGETMYKKIQDLSLSPKGIGGLTMGADPIAVAISFASSFNQNHLKAFSIRKEQKKYGMGLQIEGDMQKGDSVIIIDDVITTGKSTIYAIDIARKHKLNVLCVLVLLDRCESNGKDNIKKCGVDLHSIFTIDDFIN